MLQTNITIEQARQALSSGRHGEARRLCRDVLKRERKNLDALELLGIIELDAGSFDAAIKPFRQCQKLRPRETKFDYFVARTLSDQGRSKEAIALLEKVVKREPGIALFAHSLVVALERVGRYDRARALLEPFVEGGEATPAMLAMFGRLEMRAGRRSEAIDFLRSTLDAPSLKPQDRQLMLYVLAQVYEKTGEFDLQFEACREAKAINAPPFDPEAYRASIDRMIEVFDAERVAGMARAKRRSELPVFVAGMARSGTTLVERIVDAHPEGHGAGELIQLTKIVEALQLETGSSFAYPDCVRDLTTETCERIGARYLDHLRSLSRRPTRIVNKALDNFEHVGLISRLWPAARVIYTRRDPRDTCISCFLNPILPARYPYVTDLRHLGLAYREHERLVRDWREVLDLPQIEVVYEDLIEDQEAGTRAIIEFLGLSWDDRCLRYYESDRAVMTLSYDQVSKPIYRSAVGRWRNYEKHLGPLIEALGEVGV